ncbi:OLC1v1028945C1 [Oldenlandia corymbosa var. corymbosa]|uniref:OLC1v1028945C1 n=1 Tax=Oldenlandia corymbosa var. corymbosa TaxID=529605 RepID=A0AAV1CEI8_OLDCO|nr:OLC1v1028945C1 [Oldenlandia corymbosa var. corymbosa]
MKNLMAATTTAGKPQLHSVRLLRRAYFNGAFAAVYLSAVLAFFYRHVISLIIQSKTLASISISISVLIADLVLAFMWFTCQSCRMKMIVREVQLENLDKVITSKESFPAMDIFVCTADPYKEPPLNVVNTALSVMAYDYPPEKLSVYVSDDGGSELTLFAFMEAAKFGRFWLPFCNQNNVMDRCPHAYFNSNHSASWETQNIKDKYESMKKKIESVMKKGKVTDEYLTGEEEHEAFSQWKQGIFTRQQHPSVIQVLLESGKDKDIAGNSMPNLVYVSREKSKDSFHQFKAGALNTLPEIPELGPDYSVKEHIKSRHVMNLAHHVAGCKYEVGTHWGSEIGFKYGTVVEDFYTGYLLQCEGWHSIFYHPKRPAFLGDVPISLFDIISQNKRWFVGFLDVAFSKHSPLTYGVKAMGYLQASSYGHYSLWAIWSIPIVIYAFIPQLSLLNKMCIFPQMSDPWFKLYSFLFLGAYGRHCLDFILAQGTIARWWSEQRFWLIRGLTSHTFATFEVVTRSLGINIATQGFNVTSKVIDDEQAKRYDQGIFEFGVESPMFVPLSMAAILNLVAFLYGFLKINLDGFFVQMFVAGFGVLNSVPIYEAMILRRDKGRMPTKITIISALLVFVLYVASLFVLNM